MLQCIDKFYQEINTRCKQRECTDLFEILELTNFIETSEIELLKFAQRFVESYNMLFAEDMFKEIAYLRRFLKAAKVTKEEFLNWTSFKIPRICY